jgi:hypothetical protein
VRPEDSLNAGQEKLLLLLLHFSLHNTTTRHDTSDSCCQCARYPSSGAAGA